MVIPGNIYSASIIVSCIHAYAGQPVVKFSADPDLPEEVCQRLLHDHMSDHIKENKITQKLFIQ